jgi:hypothetical protein
MTGLWIVAWRFAYKAMRPVVGSRSSGVTGRASRAGATAAA